ncbi:MAG TPA: hypothetical protein VHL78_13060 [Actinomycetota bacterium]|nr:hypothetical protein [Actinomycetota bacterium]
MRRPIALVLGLLLAAACGGEAPPASRGSPAEPSPGEPTPTRASPASLPGASCRGRGGGSPRNIPDFVNVDVERRAGVERVTFQFRPRDAGLSRPPSHFVKFAETLSTGGEGAPAEVEGQTFVVVVFSAFGVDLSGEQPVQIYTGPTELKPGFGTVLELEQLGDFEATVTWAIGLSRKACFVVDARPDRLVLEFPSS